MYVCGLETEPLGTLKFHENIAADAKSGDEATVRPVNATA